jgi:hypothetical protein
LRFSSEHELRRVAGASVPAAGREFLAVGTTVKIGRQGGIPQVCRKFNSSHGRIDESANFPRTQKLPTARQLEQLLESDPDDVFLQYALAKARVSEGNLEAGLAQYQSVIDRHPDYVPAYFQKGQTLAERGRTIEAREILARGINVARKVGDAHAEREMNEFLESLP